MGTGRKNIFEELKKCAGCSEHLVCVSNEVRNICDRNSDNTEYQLDCLECKPGDCEFYSTSGVSAVCSCPLRNYIVKDFEGFVFDSADRIKRIND